MDQPGLHGRHRDKKGELSKKHGNTVVRTLRKVYGQKLGRSLRARRKAQRRAAQTGRAVPVEARA